MHYKIRLSIGCNILTKLKSANQKGKYSVYDEHKINIMINLLKYVLNQNMVGIECH